jgi:hypothetical protein
MKKTTPIDTKKVIPFPKQPMEKVVEELLDSHRKGKIKNLILTYTVDDSPGDGSVIAHYWFADKSCLLILGLIENIKREVLEYMRDDGFKIQ